MSILSQDATHQGRRDPLGSILIGYPTGQPKAPPKKEPVFRWI